MKFKFDAVKTIIILFSISIALIIFFIYQNNVIKITNYRYANPKLPMDFKGYKVVHISDFHNKNFYGRLSKKIVKISPDIIVITGDLIDRRNTKIDIAREFIEQITQIAPVYYVSGNHEQLSNKYDTLKEELERLNVSIIDGKYTILSKGGSEIGLMGIADPAINQTERTYMRQDNSQYIKDSIKGLLSYSGTDFNILLSHRPEQFTTYVDMDVDLIFSGHAHGGQIRIPFVGAVFAPDQGFFPKYTDGINNEKGTSMVVSRGLGNSAFPLRIFNPPEIVVVTLYSVDM